MDLLTLCLITPFVAALACIFAWRSVVAQRVIGVVGMAALTLTAALLLARVSSDGIQVVQLGNWPAPFGITLVADLLAGIMVLVSAVIGLATAIYSLADIDRERERFGYYSFLHLMMMGICGAFLTGDLFNMFVWFEVMLIASFVLMTLGGERPQMEGSVKYVILNLVSSALFLAGIGILYGKTGTLNLADLSVRASTVMDPGLLTITAMLFLVAFGVKAGIFPLFFWLPASYHTTPVAISAVFAGLLTKVGVYALIRVFTLIFTGDFDYTHTLLLILAGLTMVTGVLGAVAQFDFRRLLSFHIVSQIGYMLLGLALFTPLALRRHRFLPLPSHHREGESLPDQRHRPALQWHRLPQKNGRPLRRHPAARDPLLHPGHVPRRHPTTLRILREIHPHQSLPRGRHRLSHRSLRSRRRRPRRRTSHALLDDQDLGRGILENSRRPGQHRRHHPPRPLSPLHSRRRARCDHAGHRIHARTLLRLRDARLPATPHPERVHSSRPRTPRAMIFAINFILAIVWAGLLGNFDAWTIGSGFLLGYAALAIVYRKHPGVRYFQKPQAVIGFLGYYLLELIHSNFTVALDILTPSHRMKPGIVAVPLDAESDFEITLLANLITMTPGTLSLDLSEDRKILYVHAMYITDPDEIRRSIKQDLERRVLAVFR